MKMYLLARRLGVVAISFALASCTTTPAAAAVDRRRFKWLCRKPTNARLGAVHAISRPKAVTLPRRDGNRTFVHRLLPILPRSAARGLV
ncbi:hypothetical protein ELH53_33075 [Rhizobium ruizarguesonis]|nr:hypothetical protein [Rhizobium leguminosarum bv. viciae]TAT91653.1 hypothetical protein ELI55_37555 [Rhizobium ruizarguesonis]TAW07023.1 hypothetical protein ELI20_29245 [Rhizobium ruizarguesonis]TAZ40159.1 hypothetical protein ELH74_12365 [Rhizobium ruizarguesonis]TAZ67259.1 hypothetical protein ELH72_36580 [Rhizobium ruizarguesonis]